MKLFASTLIIILTIVGCTKSRGPYRTALLGTKLKNFDPVGLNEYNEITLISQVCGRLTAVDQGLNIEGDLAEAWDISNDRKTVTFKIKDGRHFADGSKMTLKDISYSLQRVEKAKQSLAASWGEEIKSVDILPGNQIRVTLANASPRILYIFSHPRFCILKENAPFIEINGINTPNSPGAYRITSIKDDAVELEVNRDFAKKAIEKSIEVRFLDQVTAIKEFDEGRLHDLSFYILSDKELAGIKPDSKQVDCRIYWTWIMLLNPNSAPFKKTEQRKSFISGIDQERLVSNWKTNLIASKSVIPQGMNGASNVVEPKPPQVQKFQCHSTPLRIATIEGLPSTESLNAELTAQINSLRNCHVEIVSLDMGSFMKEYEAKSYDIYVVGIDTNSTDPLGFYRQFIDGESENFLKYSSKKLSSLYKETYAESPEKRKQSEYDDIQRAFYQENIGIPLGHPVFKFVYKKEVTALHMNSLGMHLNRWWMIGRQE